MEPPPGRSGYGVYECADGAYVAISAIEDVFWERLCETIDRPDLTDKREDDPRTTPSLRCF